MTEATELPSRQPADRSTFQAVRTLGAMTARQRAVIRLLSIANRRELDPAPLMLALAQEFQGRYADRLRRLSSRMIDGDHVLDAIAKTPGVLENSHIVALRLADQAGKLPEVYDAMLATPIAGTDPVDSNAMGIGSEFFRLVLMTTVAWGILTFFSIWIMPTIQSMFDEFGVELPALAASFVYASGYLSLVTFVVFLVLTLYLFLNQSILMHWLGNRFIPSRFGRPWQPAKVRVRSLLAMIPRLNLPMDEALTTIIHAPCGIMNRRRLSKALERIKQQQEPWGALAKQGVISRREATALSACSSGAAAAWMLDRFAGRRMQRYDDGRQRHEVIFSIFNTVVLSVFVAWMAISVFLVLSEIVIGIA